MKVKFKGNTEPCIVYEVVNDTEVMEYADTLSRYCPHIDVKILGLIPKELLTEAIDHPNNIPATDIAVQLSR